MDKIEEDWGNWKLTDDTKTPLNNIIKAKSIKRVSDKEDLTCDLCNTEIKENFIPTEPLPNILKENTKQTLLTVEAKDLVCKNPIKIGNNTNNRILGHSTLKEKYNVIFNNQVPTKEEIRDVFLKHIDEKLAPFKKVDFIVRFPYLYNIICFLPNLIIKAANYVFVKNNKPKQSELAEKLKNAFLLTRMFPKDNKVISQKEVSGMLFSTPEAPLEYDVSEEEIDKFVEIDEVLSGAFSSKTFKNVSPLNEGKVLVNAEINGISKVNKINDLLKKEETTPEEKKELEVLLANKEIIILD